MQQPTIAEERWKRACGIARALPVGPRTVDYWLWRTGGDEKLVRDGVLAACAGMGGISALIEDRLPYPDEPYVCFGEIAERRRAGAS